MSPTTTEPNETEQQHNNAERQGERNHDPEAQPRAEDRRSFFQRHPAAKPIVFLVAIVALLLVGWFWWEGRHWESTDDAEIDGHIYPISARVSGHVTKVNFDDGAFVHKGDVLVQLDPTDYQVAYERAQADYADSQASAQAARVWRAGIERRFNFANSFCPGRYAERRSRTAGSAEAGDCRSGPGGRSPGQRQEAQC